MQDTSSADEPSAPGFSLANILDGHDENLEHPDIQNGGDEEQIEDRHADAGFCVECEGEHSTPLGICASKLTPHARSTRSTAL